LIEQADAVKTRTPKYGGAARNKILAQQLPKHVALRADKRVALIRRLPGLINQDCLSVNQSSFHVRFKQLDLTFQGAEQAHIIVVKKRNVLSRADQQAQVARASHTLVALDANVFDPGQFFTECGSLVS